MEWSGKNQMLGGAENTGNSDGGNRGLWEIIDHNYQGSWKCWRRPPMWTGNIGHPKRKGLWFSRYRVGSDKLDCPESCFWPWVSRNEGTKGRERDGAVDSALSVAYKHKAAPNHPRENHTGYSTHTGSSADREKPDTGPEADMAILAKEN